MKTGAIILAAGVSERMKKLRPMLHVGEKSMISHLVDTLKDARISNIVVVLGHRADSIEKHLEDSGVTFAVNRHYESTHMIDSLRVGLAALDSSCGRVVVAPADVPLFKVSTLRKLLSVTASVIRPVFNELPGHPVIISRELFSAIRSYDGERGLDGIIEAGGFSVEDVPVDDEAVTIDANTNEDFTRLLELSEARAGKGRLRMQLDISLVGEEVAINAEMMRLLEMIECTGSIQTACECLNRSYAKGWRKIKDAERELGTELIESSAGGAKGGGSRLTEEGRRILETYKKLYSEGSRYMNLLFSEYFQSGVV